MSSTDDPNKKIRKPYTITKSRESWTEPEHDKFLEALHLFDRDWKKIEAFVGSKTVIQIRSHAQKYFLKAQKNGANQHLPPPRPKRKAAHPYPHKASKIVVTKEISVFQASPAVPGPERARRFDSSTLLGVGDHDTAASKIGWTEYSVRTASFSHVSRDDVRFTAQSLPNVCYYNSNESTPCERQTVLPDFAQVYGFIGSVFDPNATGQLQNLKKMDPIDTETVLLLMRNLSINLANPDFKYHMRLLSESEKDIASDMTDHILDSESEEAA